MKHLFSFIAILLLNTGLNEQLAAQPQYYNFNSTGTENSFPFAMPDGKMVQTLHLPGEFSNPAPAPGGLITSVFVQLFAAMNNKTLNDLTIKMGQTTLTDLTTGTFYSGTMTTVYYRFAITINNPAGWLEFILDTPFPYDPTQSIVIEMSQCQSTFNTGGTIRYTLTSGIKRVWSTGGCPFTPWNVSNAYVVHTGINVDSSVGPPIVVTQAATDVTSTTARLNGTVNANGDNTTVSFEYGLTLAYGSTVEGVPALVTGTTVTPVLANITGLLTGNTYHFRVKGVNAFGTTNGLDTTFSTPPMVGIDGKEPLKVEIYPVPNDGQFSISLGGGSARAVSLEVYNNLGSKIFSKMVPGQQNSRVIPVDLRPVPAGIYNIILRSSGELTLHKIVVTK